MYWYEDTYLICDINDLRQVWWDRGLLQAWTGRWLTVKQSGSARTFLAYLQKRNLCWIWFLHHLRPTHLPLPWPTEVLAMGCYILMASIQVSTAAIASPTYSHRHSITLVRHICIMARLYPWGNPGPLAKTVYLPFASKHAMASPEQMPHKMAFYFWYLFHYPSLHSG